MPELPRLLYQAGEKMVIGNDDNSVVVFFQASADYYQRFYGPKNIFIPLTIKRIGDYLFNCKDFANAITYYKKANDSIYKQSIELTKNCAEKIGICYIELGNYPAAEKYINVAIRIEQNSSSKDSMNLGYLFNNLGAIYAKTNRTEDARHKYEEAIGYFSMVNDSNELGRAFIFNNIGNLLLAEEHFSEALEMYEKSLSIRKASLPIKDIELTQSYYNLGYCFFLLHQLDSALFYNQKSIESNTLSQEDPDSYGNPSDNYCISASDMIMSLLDKAEYLINISSIPGKNNEDKLVAANETLKKALGLFIEIDCEIVDIKSKIAWSFRNNRLFNLLIISNFISNSDQSSVFQLLWFGDLKRNFVYKPYSDKAGKNEFGSKEYLLSENRKHSDYVQDLKKEGFLITGGNENGNHAFLKQKNQTGKEFDKKSISHLQEKLESDQAIITFSVCDSIIARHLITTNKIIGGFFTCDSLKQISANHINSIRTYGDCHPSGLILYTLLLKDLEPHIKNFSEIIFVPDDYLFLLPFETLVNDQSQDYLIEKYTISYSFSLESLSTTSGHHDLENIFVGYSPWGKAANQSIIGEELNIDTLNLNLLKSADIEIYSISEMLRANEYYAFNFFGSDATITNLIEVKLPVDYIHIATHNVPNWTDPWLSYMQFYPDSIFTDGKLYLPLISSMNLAADCLVLSGCGTGNGKNMGNEGILSIAHAFASNSINNLILSLWEVEDNYIKGLMHNFYAARMKGNSISQGLRNSKIIEIKGNFNHPFFWSSITHYYNGL